MFETGKNRPTANQAHSDQIVLRRLISVDTRRHREVDIGAGKVYRRAVEEMGFTRELHAMARAKREAGARARLRSRRYKSGAARNFAHTKEQRHLIAITAPTKNAKDQVGGMNLSVYF